MSPETIAVSNYDFILRISRRLCRESVILADDVAHNTLVKVLSTKAHFMGRSSVKSWLYTIVRREFYTLLSDHLKHKAIPLDDSNLEPTYRIRVLESFFACNALRTAFRVWKDLAKRQRKIVWYYFACNMNYPEIAEKMSIPINVIGSNILRAREKFRAALEGSYGYGTSN